MEAKKKVGDKTWWVEVEATKTMSIIVFAKTEKEARAKALEAAGWVQEEDEAGGEVSHIEEMEDE